MATFNVDATLGCLEVGATVSTLLFGILTVQTYIYYSSFPKDSRWLKSMVATVWLCELGHSLVVSHAVYTMTITQYGRPQELVRTPNSLNSSIIFSGLVASIVQAYFAQRVRAFSRKLTIPLLCWLLTFLRFLGSIIATVEALKMVTLEQFHSEWQWLLTALLGVGACVDVVLAASLCFYLRKRRLTTFERTMRLVDQLIVWTIETGLVTSITAVALMICLLTMTTNFVWVAIFVFLAKCFSNSLLATLNGRHRLRKLNVEATNSDSHHPGSGFQPFPPQSMPIAIQMFTTTAVDTEISDNTKDPSV